MTALNTIFSKKIINFHGFYEESYFRNNEFDISRASHLQKDFQEEVSPKICGIKT